MKTDILGVAFDALTLDEAEKRADALLRSGAGGYIVTANPEIVLHCREDAAYAAAVNGAALVLADGVGDLCAARILGTPLPERVTGADLVPRLLSRLAQRSGSVFLYGARPGVAQRAGEKLKSAYPGLRIAGAENGYISDETALFAGLEQKKPDLLLLGLGAPRQELWMARNRQKTNAVMIGVGGLLDVFAGDIPRRAGELAAAGTGMALPAAARAEAPQAHDPSAQNTASRGARTEIKKETPEGV